MRKEARIGLGTMALAVAVAATSASAAPVYQLTDLGVLAGFSDSYVYALSDDGRQVSGWLRGDSGNRAFRWSAGSGMELLSQAPGATASRAFGINNAGVVVGESSYSPTRRIATVWDTTGGVRSLGTLPDPDNPDSSSVGFGVNQDGTVAGWSDSAEGTRAFAWTESTGMRSVGTLEGGTETHSYSINAGGDIVGWGTSPSGDRGFIASASGSMTSVGTLSDDPASRTRAYGVSNSGYVAGDARDPSTGDVAFFWTADTGLTPLGRLESASASYGADVNSDGFVVGWNEGGLLGEQGFLWSAADGMLSLTSLLAGSDGWQVQRARSINDLGDVIANAMNPDGQVRAVLLRPVSATVSEPSVLGLLTAGLLLGFGRRRRERAQSAAQ